MKKISPQYKKMEKISEKKSIFNQYNEKEGSYRGELENYCFQENEAEKKFFKDISIDISYINNIKYMQNLLISHCDLMKYLHFYGQTQMNRHLLKMEKQTFSSMLDQAMKHFNRRLDIFFSESRDLMFKFFSAEMNLEEPRSFDHEYTLNRKEEDLKLELDEELKKDKAKLHYENLIRDTERLKEDYKHDEYIMKTTSICPSDVKLMRNRVQMFCIMHYSGFLADMRLTGAFEKIHSFQKSGSILEGGLKMKDQGTMQFGNQEREVELDMIEQKTKDNYDKEIEKLKKSNEKEQKKLKAQEDKKRKSLETKLKKEKETSEKMKNEYEKLKREMEEMKRNFEAQIQQKEQEIQRIPQLNQEIQNLQQQNNELQQQGNANPNGGEAAGN